MQNQEGSGQWSKIDLMGIPKSRNFSDESNYRGIAQSNISVKIINRMIFHGIQPMMLGGYLGLNQNGFRSGKFIFKILAQKCIIARVKWRQLPAIITFIDFSKAFDSTHWDNILMNLRIHGIQEEFIFANAKDLREDQSSCFVTWWKQNGFFQTLSWVLQGDTLAPYLFVIVLCSTAG